MSENAPRSVQNRWSEFLTKSGWTPVSNIFLTTYHRLDITSLEAMFVIHLMMFKWEKKAPFPKLSTVARRMGVSTTSVRTHARRLEEKGFLKRKPQPGRANIYLLDPLFAALEKEANESKDEFETWDTGLSQYEGRAPVPPATYARAHIAVPKS